MSGVPIDQNASLEQGQEWLLQATREIPHDIRILGNLFNLAFAHAIGVSRLERRVGDVLIV